MFRQLFFSKIVLKNFSFNINGFILDLDPNSMYVDPQHCWLGRIPNCLGGLARDPLPHFYPKKVRLSFPLFTPHEEGKILARMQDESLIGCDR